MKIGCLIQLLLILFITTTLSCGDRDCENVTCESGGTCKEGYCYCPTSYTGDRCQYQTCDITDCPPNSTCLPTGEWGAAVCRCHAGFEGHDCNTQSITKFLGDYIGVQECQVLGNSGPIDWSVINNWSGFEGPLDIQFMQSGFPPFIRPISCQLLDSVQFNVPHQYLSYYNEVILPIGNGIRAVDGTITFRFVISNATMDTCLLTLTPK